MRTSAVIALATLATATACGAVSEYRQTGDAYAGRGPSCEYVVLRGPVAEPYTELGVIDVDAFHVGSMPKTEEAFRETVGPHVCAAGGHGVIAAIDVNGKFIHGTVVRFHPRQCEKCDEHGKEDADEEGS